MSRIFVGRRQELPAPSVPTDPIERGEVFAAGCRSLGIAVFQSALAHDPGWFARERGAVAFWCDVIGINPSALQEALRRRQAGQPVA